VTAAAPSLSMTPLRADPFVAVVTPDDPLARQASVSAGDLAGEPFILSRSGCEALVRAYFADAGATLAPAYEVRDTPTILAMVREGLGVTVLSRLSLSESPAGLAALPLDPPAVRDLALAVPAGAFVAPAVQVFIDEAARLLRVEA
jgi:DNA-binding transcriptional LysR family regulator